MRIRNPFERLSDWQGNYIECLSRACGSRCKVCIREFREFIIVMPNLNYDIPQDFEENEIRSEFARTRMQIISIQIKK